MFSFCFGLCVCFSDHSGSTILVYLIVNGKGSSNGCCLYAFPFLRSLFVMLFLYIV